MTHFPDLLDVTMIDRGSHIRAIGWLDCVHPFPTGLAPTEFVEKLDALVQECGESTKALGWIGFKGGHECELCDDFITAGHLGVPAGDLLYVTPQMVVHYIRKHLYSPPQEFVDAVMSSPLPGTSEYAEAVSSFRDLNVRRMQIKGKMGGPLVQYLRQAALEAMRQGGGDSAVNEEAYRILGTDDSETTSRIKKFVELLSKIDSDS